MSVKYTPENASCHIHTYKEGLLSKVAHDLDIVVESFLLEWEGGRISATFDASSLRVKSTMKNGKPTSSLLTGPQFREIEETIRKSILDSATHPEVEFESNELVEHAGRAEVRGQLSIRGSAQPVRAVLRDEGSSWVCRVGIDQRDYGIEPFSAMLGTLKIKPRIDVVLSLQK